MANPNNKEMQVSPTDPAQQSMDKQTALMAILNDNLEGSSKIASYTNLDPKIIQPKMHPYIVKGGSAKPEYNVIYKNMQFTLKAKSLMEAAEEGYNKMVNSISGFAKKKVKIGVQRRNKKRENHIYYFLVKKEKIKNPYHSFKITFTKIKNNS